MSDFDKLYTLMLERYSGYQDSVRIFYHGTKMENLRSILKQGLVANRPSTGWGSDSYPGVHEPTLKPIPNSIYVTEYLGTAMDAGYGDDGVLIVVLQLTDRVLNTDEDDLKNYTISPEIIDVEQGNDENDDNIVLSHATHLNNPSTEDDYMNRWVNMTTNRLKEPGILSDIQLNIIIKKLKSIYQIFLYRQCAYILKYRKILNLTKSTEYYESKYLKAMEWLTIQTRRFTQILDRNEPRYENGRLAQSVGYRGKNKIVCVFSVKNYYETTLHYGEPPPEVKELYKFDK